MVQRGPRLKSKKERAKDIEFNALAEEMVLAMSMADMSFLAHRQTPTFRMEAVLCRFYDWAENYK